jgi:hypothetical protein
VATLTPTAMTYPEWALRHDSDGKISTLVDMLSQNNGILSDAISVECQSGNAFEYTQVTKLPTPTRRSYNMGIPASLAGVAKLVATCSEYADWSKFDKSLAELGGNLAALRAQEDNLHMEGISQSVASDLFYGNRSTDPTQFTGLANIYNTVSTATSLIANNVIDCGGTGSDNTSMWLVTWGPKQIHTIYPKGTQAGLQHRDMGLLPALDTNSNEYLAYRTYMEWKLGLAIHDWRFAVRACNIDVSDLTGGSAANLINTLVKMVHKTPVAPVGVSNVQTSDSMVDTLTPMRSAIYVNRTVGTFLDLQAMNKTNVLLKMEEWGGKPVTTFRGVPIRNVDALLDTEARVV